MTQLTKQIDTADLNHTCVEDFEIEALDKPMIAALSHAHIYNMTNKELVRVIQAADLQIPNRALHQNLEFQNRATLERMAFLARRCCRHSGY